MHLSFTKMNGLGNDFVLLDARATALPCESELPYAIRAISNRQRGIGCDQLLVMRPSAQADIFMQIFNADGSEVAACGNATRCVAWHIMQEQGRSELIIETKAGLLPCHKIAEKRVTVTMGIPRTSWQVIPLDAPADTCHIAHGIVGLDAGVAVNVGNPHLVIFVDDVTAIPLAEIGHQLEHASFFPERANITIAEIITPAHIMARTWERGVGITHACGTAACATMVAARRRGLVEAHACIEMQGGALEIAWQGDEAHPDHPVMMTGDVAYNFHGIIAQDVWGVKI